MVDPRAIGYGSELGPPTGYGTKRRDAGNGSLTPEQDMQLEKDPLLDLLPRWLFCFTIKSLSGLVFLADELSSFFHREGGYFDLQFFLSFCPWVLRKGIR